MSKQKREPEKLVFTELPCIGHRGDAIDLLKWVIEAESVEGLEYVHKALLDALIRFIV